MVLNKEKPTKNRRAFPVVAVVILTVLMPFVLLFGGIALFSYINFNSEHAREDARYEAETQLNSIPSVKYAAVVEHLGGTPPNKKSLDVRLFVDETPDEDSLVAMVKAGFERTWLNYDAFRPDSISVIVIKGEASIKERTDRSASFLSKSVRVGRVSTELKWLTGGASDGSVSASSMVLEKVFGPSGRDR